MRKVLTLFLVLSIVGFCLTVPAAAEELSDYSIEAADQYCTQWNNYFAQNGINMQCGYVLEDDSAQVDCFSVLYNRNAYRVDYRSGIIPSNATLCCMYDVQDQEYDFCVYSDGELKSNLEKAIIYTDDGVINDILCLSGHDSGDMWSITLTPDDLLTLLDYDQFTVRFTIDGKSEVIDISEKEYDYLYDMTYSLLMEQLFTDKTYEKYSSADYLPDGSVPAPIQETIAETKYSFRSDYDAIEQSAKSLFYVEVYDKNVDYIGNASGFVAFDEHLFITNQHVIDEGSYLKIWDEDNNVFILDQVIASSKTRDIAILLFPQGMNYRSLELNGDEALKRGQPVVTIGSPQGFQGTVTEGIISAFPEVYNYPGIKCIQFTAPTSPGSSGGALFDDSGKVIGITSSGMEEGQNLNFAVPIRFVQELYDQWDKKSYERLGTTRSWNMSDTASANHNNQNNVRKEEKVQQGINSGISANNEGIISLNIQNVEDYFNISFECLSSEKDRIILKYSISPKDDSIIQYDQSDENLVLNVRANAYESKESSTPLREANYTLIIKREEKYVKTNKIFIYLSKEYENICWDYEITGCKGEISIVGK